MWYLLIGMILALLWLVSFLISYFLGKIKEHRLPLLVYSNLLIIFCLIITWPIIIVAGAMLIQSLFYTTMALEN